MANPTKAILIPTIHVNAREFLWTLLIWSAVACTLAAVCQIASGQDKSLEVAEKYREEMAPYDASAEELKGYRSRNRVATRAISDDGKKIDEILENNGNTADPIMAEFFEGYVFPSMTLLDTRVMSSLGAKRTKFMKDYLSPNVRGATRNAMIDLTIKATQNICKNPDLHPAARLNAAYLMGMLDQVPLIRLENQLPVPSKAAFKSLSTILDSQDASSFPDYLKVAALAGIQRHVEIDSLAGGQIPAAEKQALLQKLTTILNNNGSDELTYWLKRRAMQVIGFMGDPGSLDTVIAVLKSKDAGTWLRFDAMETIGKLKLKTDSIAKNMDAAVAITEFINQSLDAESKSIEAAVGKLVFDNLLFQNLDLLASGTDYENDSAAATGSGGTAMGAGDSPGGADAFGGGGRGGLGGGRGGLGGGRGGLGGGRGGLGGGRGGLGGGRGGFGGGFGGGSMRPVGELLELPGYQLNLIRRRIKTLAFTGANVLGGDDGEQGMKLILDADGKTFADKVIKDLRDALEKSNVGIVDLDDKVEEPLPGAEPPPAVTQQLIDICADSARSLDGHLRAQKGELAAPVSAPAAEVDPDEPDFK